ncbi:hypothetical protein CS022_20800 [Veronia nyctiphanis]|uniref:Uncharacterized protein n=1 Tax=Veronia nyctiphanis TaxID=1278244 RepID=A0A4Q0YL67_9GAMM|nr:hypothetical protein [Veronia nyctiphanis]RXJ71527.1 hypothetical protein CS022_20800 [Veronia nyctiphanis]
MKKLTFIALLSVLLSGCITYTNQEKPNASMPGSDRDEYGCIGSAGYTWCESKNECVRSWELAKEEGFENTQAAYDAFCATK